MTDTPDETPDTSETTTPADALTASLAALFEGTLPQAPPDITDQASDTDTGGSRLSGNWHTGDDDEDCPLFASDAEVAFITHGAQTIATMFAMPMAMLQMQAFAGHEALHGGQITDEAALTALRQQTIAAYVVLKLRHSA